MNELKENNFRYFVLKTDDLVNALTGEELMQFNNFLIKVECFRQEKGKPRYRDYWVAGRHWKCGPKVKETIEKIEGIKLNESKK